MAQQGQRKLKFYEKAEDYFNCGVTMVVGKADEDNYSVTLKDNSGSASFAVFDGHGGDTASSLCSELFSEKIFAYLDVLLESKKQDPRYRDGHIFEGLFCEAVKRATEAINDLVIASGETGTTAVLLVTQRNPRTGTTKLYCVNVGDSRCVFGKVVKGSWTPVINLSVDHNLANESEVKRVSEKTPALWPLLPEDAYSLAPNKGKFAQPKEGYTEAQREEVSALRASLSSLSEEDHSISSGDGGNGAVMYTHTSRQASPDHALARFNSTDDMQMIATGSGIEPLERMTSLNSLRPPVDVEAVVSIRPTHGITLGASSARYAPRPPTDELDFSGHSSHSSGGGNLDATIHGGPNELSSRRLVMNSLDIGISPKYISPRPEEGDAIFTSTLGNPAVASTRRQVHSVEKKCTETVAAFLEDCLSGSLNMAAASCYLSPALIEAMEGASASTLVLFSSVRSPSFRQSLSLSDNTGEDFDDSQALACFESRSILERSMMRSALLISIPFLHEDTQQLLGVIQVVSESDIGPRVAEAVEIIKARSAKTADAITEALQMSSPPRGNVPSIPISSRAPPVKPVAKQRVIKTRSSTATIDGRNPLAERSFIAHRQDTDGRRVGPMALFGRFNMSTLMTRAIGGKYTARSCVCIPEISVCDIRKDEFGRIILATDGVWDLISSDEALSIVRNIANPLNASRNLAMRARLLREQQGIKLDDITVIIVDINPDIRPKGIFSSFSNLFSLCGGSS